MMTMHSGGGFRSTLSAGLVLSLFIGGALATTPVSAAGQRDERGATPAQSASDAAMSRVPSLRSAEQRGPFADLFGKPVKTRGNVSFGGPTLLDANPGPSTQLGPCGLVIRDYRRGGDPKIVVPIAPGDFSVRQVVPQTCSSH